MIELSTYVFEMLLEDGEFVVSRGRSKGGGSRLLLIEPAAEYPSTRTFEQLKNVYSIKEKLDPDWATQPISLERREGRPQLLLLDPGGELLDVIVGSPLRIGEFLRIATSIAGNLRSLHAAGLIHGNLKPANILADRATGNTWLTGFGITSPVPRGRQTPEGPKNLSSVLAYTAPEQTGRVNRSVDARSDLYSFGVILYQMLTAALPFSATDPMEWVHCHIATQPTPPSERAEGIPGMISAIVMKLLSKNADERYQTALGVEADLRTCRGKWESGLFARVLPGNEKAPYRRADLSQVSGPRVVLK